MKQWYVANVVKDKLKVEGDRKWEHAVVFVFAHDEQHALQSIAKMAWMEERFVDRSQTRPLQIFAIDGDQQFPERHDCGCPPAP